MSSFSIRVNIGDLLAGYDATLQQIEDAARPAAQAGAQVLYDEVKRRAPRSKKGHWFHGKQFKVNGTKYWFDAGTLQNAIYQVFSKSNSSAGRATYHVSWNDKKVPYAHMVEFGTSKAPAHPFVRPAVSKLPAAEQAMRERFFAELAAKGVIR